MDLEEKKKLKKRVKEILLLHGIKMEVIACGCCESPEVTFEYKGERIVDEVAFFNFSMLEDDND